MVASIRKVLIIILSAISMVAEASQQCMVLSNGSEMSFAHFREGILHIEFTLFKTSKVKMLNPVWPSYDESTGDLVFGAHEQGVSGIYKANSVDFFKSAELLMPGNYPALSPDGDMIAYVNEHHIIAVKDIFSGTDILIDEPYETLSLWRRPVWLSNNELIYVTRNDDVFVFNRSENSHSKLFSKKLFPVASRSGVVLFVDHDARSLFEYKAGELKLVFENRFLSISPGIVLFGNGDDFLYSRQTWSQVIRLSESNTTFYFSRSGGSEKELMSKFSLFGGSLLPCGKRGWRD